MKDKTQVIDDGGVLIKNVHDDVKNINRIVDDTKKSEGVYIIKISRADGTFKDFDLDVIVDPITCAATAIFDNCTVTANDPSNPGTPKPLTSQLSSDLYCYYPTDSSYELTLNVSLDSEFTIGAADVTFSGSPFLDKFVAPPMEGFTTITITANTSEGFPESFTINITPVPEGY